VATFLDSYDDHAVLGVAAKKEASELLDQFKALLAADASGPKERGR
jgi:hypothetical protein